MPNTENPCHEQPQRVSVLPGLTCFPTKQRGKEEAVGGEQPAAPPINTTNLRSSSGIAAENVSRIIMFLSRKS